jgi:hypothetical protein
MNQEQQECDLIKPKVDLIKCPTLIASHQGRANPRRMFSVIQLPSGLIYSTQRHKRDWQWNLQYYTNCTRSLRPRRVETSLKQTDQKVLFWQTNRTCSVSADVFTLVEWLNVWRPSIKTIDVHVRLIERFVKKAGFIWLLIQRLSSMTFSCMFQLVEAEDRWTIQRLSRMSFAGMF